MSGAHPRFCANLQASSEFGAAHANHMGGRQATRMSYLALFDSVSLFCLVLAMVAQFWDWGGERKERLQNGLMNVAFWGWLVVLGWLLIFHPKELEREASSFLHSTFGR
jgi:hypothetical protein